MIEHMNAAVKEQTNNKDWVFINYTYKRFEGLPKSWQGKS